MSPELAQAWFRVAIFITIISGILIFFEPRDSAEFVVSVMSFIVGLIFIAVIAIAVKRSK